jgi:hypothetical protein
VCLCDDVVELIRLGYTIKIDEYVTNEKKVEGICDDACTCFFCQMEKLKKVVKRKDKR